MYEDFFTLTLTSIFGHFELKNTRKILCLSGLIPISGESIHKIHGLSKFDFQNFRINWLVTKSDFKKTFCFIKVVNFMKSAFQLDSLRFFLTVLKIFYREYFAIFVLINFVLNFVLNSFLSLK
jgi:hypothetical protein